MNLSEESGIKIRKN